MVIYPVWGDPVGISSRSLAPENYESICRWAIVCRCLRDPRFSRFVQYRRVTDGQTSGHTTTAYTTLAQRRSVKKLSKSVTVYEVKASQFGTRLDRVKIHSKFLI